MYQLAFVVIPMSIKRIYEINIVAYRSHDADVGCDVHLHANARRHEQTNALFLF